MPRNGWFDDFLSKHPLDVVKRLAERCRCSGRSFVRKKKKNVGGWAWASYGYLPICRLAMCDRVFLNTYMYVGV